MPIKSVSNSFSFAVVQDVPVYFEEWFAYSNAESTASVTNEPTPHTPWSTSIPGDNGGYAYLWRKSIRHELNSQTNTYSSEPAQYVRMSGTNGTSIHPAGSLDYVAGYNQSLPGHIEGGPAGLLGIVQGDPNIYVSRNVYIDEVAWDTVYATASDGDGYTIKRDCIVDLEVDGTTVNLKGHMVMWSAEAHTKDSSMGWIDLGQFKGDPAIQYYTHIAWAINVTLSQSELPIPDGQTNRPNATAVTGGSISPSSDRPWMGILIDTNSGQDSTHYAEKYTWSYNKGQKGDDGTDGQDMRENLINYTGETIEIDLSNPYATIGSQRYYRVPFKIQTSKIPSLGTRVAGRAKLTLAGCTLNSNTVINLYVDGSSYNPRIVQPTAPNNGVYDIKDHSFVLDTSASPSYNGAIGLRIDNLGAAAGTLTIEHVKWEAADKSSEWCLSEADKKGDTPIQVFIWAGEGDTPTISGNAYPPEGWSVNPPAKPYSNTFLWESHSVLHGDGSIDNWGTPICITGEKGDPGADAENREWIYKYDNTGYDGNIGQVNPSGAASASTNNKNQKGWVPYRWYNHALPVSNENKTVYASWRDITGTGNSKTYGAFLTPIPWSHWGERGLDGDGVQYLFKLFDHELNASERNTEKPPMTGTGAATYNSQTGKWECTGWSDEPLAPTVSMQYCYCSVIQRIQQVWGAFGTLGLWSKYSKDGKDSQFVYLKGTARDKDGSITSEISDEVRINGGSNVATHSRGLNLVTINRQTLAVVEAIRYDTYGQAAGESSTGITDLIRKLNDIQNPGESSVYQTTDVFVCLVSYDAVGWSGELITKLQEFGMSDLPYTATGRYPFVFIGYKNLGKGNGVTRMNPLGSYLNVAEISAYVANGALTMKDGYYTRNSIVLQLYKRSASQPDANGMPTTRLYYKFSTKKLYTDAACTTELTNTNGWSAIPPEGTNPLYVTAATASSYTDIDEIETNEWAGAVKYVENGAQGGHGVNTATVSLYQRYAPTEQNPTPAVPSSVLTYIFASGELSGSLGNWQRTVPQANGNPCFVIQATALGTGTQDPIYSSEWGTPTVLAEDGVDGYSFDINPNAMMWNTKNDGTLSEFIRQTGIVRAFKGGGSNIIHSFTFGDMPLGFVLTLSSGGGFAITPVQKYCRFGANLYLMKARNNVSVGDPVYDSNMHKQPYTVEEVGQSTGYATSIVCNGNTYAFTSETTTKLTRTYNISIQAVADNVTRNVSLQLVPNKAGATGSQGPKGDATRQPYEWGTWEEFASSASNTATANKYEAPYFLKEEEYKDSQDVYRVKVTKWLYVGPDREDFNYNDVDTPSSQNANFAIMVTDFKYLISEAQIADYGKFGAGIFDKDYAFSQYGRVDGAASDIDHYKNFRPEFFKGEPYTMFSGSKVISNSTYPAATPYEFGTVFLENGIEYTFDFTFATAAGSAIHFNLIRISDGQQMAAWVGNGQSTISKQFPNGATFGSGEMAIRAYSTSGSITFTRITVTASKAFRPNIYIDWRRGELFSQLGHFINVVVEGVLNNLVQKITNGNYNRILRQFENSMAWLDPLSCGNVIQFDASFFTGQFSSGYELFLPFACRAGNTDPYATIGGERSLEQGGAQYSLNDVRQCVGKKIYILNPPQKSIKFRCVAAGTISLLVEKNNQLNTLENLQAGVWTYPHVTNDYLQQIGYMRLANGMYPTNSSGDTQSCFIILECKMGVLNNSECIYWELSHTLNNLDYLPDE